MNLQIEQSMNRIADGARGSVRGMIDKAHFARAVREDDFLVQRVA